MAAWSKEHFLITACGPALWSSPLAIQRILEAISQGAKDHRLKLKLRRHGVISPLLHTYS
jgi:hypothetical protein